MIDKLGLEGFGSEGSLVALLMIGGLIFKQYVVPWLKLKQGKVPNRRTSDNPGNPNGRPGAAKECRAHEVELAKIRTELEAHEAMDQKRTDDIITEMREAFKRVHERIDAKQDKP